MDVKASSGNTILGRSNFKWFDLPRILRWVLVLLLYLVTFSALDQLTRTVQLFPGVVAWYPPDGLSLAFLLTFGTGFTPVFSLASLISSLVIYRFSSPLGPILVWAVVLPTLYGITAFLLRRRVRIDPQLKYLRDTLWLILSSAIVSTILALLSVSAFVKDGTVPSSQYLNAFAEWWIGEMIGVLVFTPFLLVHVMPWLKRFVDEGWTNSRRRIVLHRPSLQSIGQVISVPVALYLVFGVPALRAVQPLYLTAGPLIWIAVRNGFSKVSLAIVVMNFGTLLAIWLDKLDPSSLGELQFLMFGVYASTLLTGAIVTKQKMTEEQLRQREVRNRALIENAPDAIILLGADGLFKYLSPATQRILGYAPEDSIGSDPVEITHPDDLPALLKLLEGLAQEPGKTVTTQYRFRHKDRSWRWLESTITNLLTEPSVQAMVFNFRDITTRKQSDEALQRSEKRFRALVENSLEEISLVNSEGILTYESATTRRPLGYPPNSIVGNSLFDLFHPDEREAAIQLLQQSVEHPGSVQEAMFRLMHQDGSWRWMEGILTNLLDEPAVQSVVINYRDITERKRAEDEVQALLEMMLGAATTESLPELLELIRQSLAKVIFAENFFVVFHNSITGLFEEVFAMDKYDPPMSPSRLEKSITAYVFRTGQPLLLTQTDFEELKARGEVELVGTSPASWLGAPLRTPSETIGIMAVQNYEDPNCYSERDKEFIASVGAQVALVIERKRAEQEIASLAKFPSENPNPVLRLSQDGNLLYANTASDALLNMWGCTVGGSVPRFLCDLADQVLSSRQNKIADIECDGKVYSMIITPVVEAAYVNLYGRDITKRIQAEEEIKISNQELAMLFELSHSLADADNLKHILDLVNRHAVESIHCTFARIALLEDGKFSMRAAYPIRVLDHDLGVGHRNLITSLPYSLRVLEQNEPRILRASDTGIGNEEKEVLLLDFAQSLCVIPLRSSDSSPTPVNLLGLLMLGEARNEGREPFTPAKIRLAQSIGDLAAIAIRRVLLSEQTGRRLQQSIALSEIDLKIISTSDMAVSLEVLLRHTTEQLGVDAAGVWWFNPTSQELEYVIGRGFCTSAFENPEPIHLGEGNAGRAALERRTIHVANLTIPNDNLRLAKALAVEPFISYYAVPLIVKEQIKGVLELFHRTELESNEEWLNFLYVLANQAAIAIDNSSLFNDLQYSNSELTRAYDATIQGWSRALDLRDKETEGHTQRVTELTVKLGRQLGLSEEALIHVRRGALLHDIGKMGVPDGILLKAGPLTDEEWVIMKKHPYFAYEMLSPIHYLRPALDIPYCHHEKWDGTGYPRGLHSDQIPFAARLFAVVDVWDALTSDRPYRAAWTEERTRDHIRSLAGTHFDPQVVQVCLDSGLLKGQTSR